jgi:hypothetical protein
MVLAIETLEGTITETELGILNIRNLLELAETNLTRLLKYAETDSEMVQVGGAMCGALKSLNEAYEMSFEMFRHTQLFGADERSRRTV